MFPSLLWPFGSSAATQASVVVGDVDGTTKTDSDLVALLRHYEAVDALPPSARVDPALAQRERQPLGLLDLWKYGRFVATKATEVAGDFVAHHLWGPRKKSWGIEMTLITSFMRNASKHSQLADIVLLRRLIGLAGYVPLPSDAMVTPVTFRVRKRKLRGLLAECSSVETGSRELSGEWVVGKKLWNSLQREWKTAQGDRHKGGQDSPSRSVKDRVVLYLHGGAYYMFSATTHRILTIQLSKYTDSRIFALDYRLAPETRFPGQLHDAVCAYLRLLEELHIPSENIVIAGDSAGGGLSLALLMYLRDNKYPLPSGAILMSPWVDLTMSCESWDSNSEYDVVPVPTPGDHLNPVLCYLGQQGMERYLTHPYASPLFGEFKGLPPLLIQVGDAEVLRDEITLLAHKASISGVKVHHELYEDAVHVFQTFPFLECSEKAFLSARNFVKNILPLQQSQSPQLLDNAAKAGLEREIDNNARTVRGDGQEMDETNGSPSMDVDSAEGSQERRDDFERPSWTRRHSQFLGNVEYAADENLPATSIRAENSSEKVSSRRAAARASLRPPSTSQSVVNVTEEFSAESSTHNHKRRMTGGLPRLSTLSMAPSVATAPTPTIRSRSRAISHPDISSLCQQWSDSGPANRTTRYSTIARPDGSS